MKSLLPEAHSDDRLELAVSRTLRIGLALAGTVVLAGTVLLLVQQPHATADYRLFHGQPSELHTLGGILRGVWALRPRAIIQLGLLLLVATPIARVALAAVGFARQRDRLYVVVALVVLLGLLGGALTSSSTGSRAPSPPARIRSSRR